jgi:hypothetical protein
MTPDELEATMRANPQGCANKYLENGDRLRAIERSWAKTQQQDAQPLPAAPAIDGASIDGAAFCMSSYPQQGATPATLPCL